MLPSQVHNLAWLLNLLIIDKMLYLRPKVIKFDFISNIFTYFYKICWNVYNRFILLLDTIFKSDKKSILRELLIYLQLKSVISVTAHLNLTWFRITKCPPSPTTTHPRTTSKELKGNKYDRCSPGLNIRPTW